ncbi:MAG: DUF3489 domain-containing protein [Parvibaculum sp.]|nr:DUF3489 domain-containing protein [Parvibaculum sp.]
MKTQSNKTQARKPTKKSAPQHQARSKPSAAAIKPTAKTRAAPRVAKPSSTAPTTSSKLATVIQMLKRPSGTTINDLSAATGWQTHSVRGLLSGTIKKKLGLKLTSEKVEGVRSYRIGA